MPCEYPHFFEENLKFCVFVGGCGNNAGGGGGVNNKVPEEANENGGIGGKSEGVTEGVDISLSPPHGEVRGEVGRYNPNFDGHLFKESKIVYLLLHQNKTKPAIGPPCSDEFK